MSVSDAVKPCPDVPLAILRTIRAIALHPHVKRVEINEAAVDADSISVVIDILTHFPPRWTNGSPGGVREIETVTLAFPRTYPLQKPRAFLREDFPTDHPHLQPGSNTRPEACLLNGDVREFIQAGGGILALMDQLVIWLDKAARLDLMDFTQGWEPVRRDEIENVLAIDENAARLFSTRNAGVAFLDAMSFRLLEKGVPCRVKIDASNSIPLKPDFAKAAVPMRSRRFKNGVFRRSIAIISWGGYGSGGTNAEYQPENVTNVAGLLDKAEQFGCRPQLVAQMNLLANRLKEADFGVSLPVPILLLARRPVNVLGTNSPVEIVPYLVEVSHPKDLSNPSSPVRTAATLGLLSTDILQRVSGIEDNGAHADWALIGCGSVGSKIATHLARSGLGPSCLIDKEWMQPHNFARHSLIPSFSDLDDTLFMSKANAVCGDIYALGHKDTRFSELDVAGISDPGLLKEIFPRGLTFAVNTTGSHVVREAISFAWPRKARPDLRTVEACLMGGGRLGFHAIEGADANPNASDLMAELYHDLRGEERSELRELAYAQAAEEIAIGQGCSSRSLRLPDAELSALTASLAIRTRRLLTHAVTPAGTVAVGEFDFDDLSMAWRTFEVPPYTLLPSVTNRPDVRISKRVVDEIERQVQSKPGSETGGILIGRFSQIGNAFQVIDTLPAPADSSFSRNEFVLGTEGLRFVLNRLQSETDGKLYALGTWHNHLAPSGPSSIDRETAKKLAIGQLFPVLLLISTPTGFRTLVAEAFHENIDGTSK